MIRDAHGMGCTMDRDFGGLLYEQPRLRVVHRAAGQRCISTLYNVKSTCHMGR